MQIEVNCLSYYRLMGVGKRRLTSNMQNHRTALSTQPRAWQTLEHERHASRRAKVLAWLGDHPVRLSMDWAELQKRTTLGPVDRRAAGLLAVPRRLPELAEAGQLAPTRAEALVVAMLLVGGAEPDTSGERPQAEDATAPIDFSLPIDEPIGEATQPQAQVKEDEELELDLPAAKKAPPPAADSGGA